MKQENANLTYVLRSISQQSLINNISFSAAAATADHIIYANKKSFLFCTRQIKQQISLQKETTRNIHQTAQTKEFCITILF